MMSHNYLIIMRNVASRNEVNLLRHLRLTSIYVEQSLHSSTSKHSQLHPSGSCSLCGVCSHSGSTRFRTVGPKESNDCFSCQWLRPHVHATYGISVAKTCGFLRFIYKWNWITVNHSWGIISCYYFLSVRMKNPACSAFSLYKLLD